MSKRCAARERHLTAGAFHPVRVDSAIVVARESLAEAAVANGAMTDRGAEDLARGEHIDA